MFYLTTHSTHFIYGYMASGILKKCLVTYLLESVTVGRSNEGRKEGRKEMFYLTTHSTHFIYGYMASGI